MEVIITFATQTKEMVKHVKKFISLFVNNLLLFFYLKDSPPPSPPSLHPSLSDIEMQATSLATLSNPTSNFGLSFAAGEDQGWGKMILGFSFPAAIALLALSFQIKPPIPFSFHVLCLTVMFAFFFSFVGISFNLRYPNTSKVLELMGVVFAVLAFFLAMQISLLPSLRWVVWVICILTFSCILSSFCYSLRKA